MSEILVGTVACTKPEETSESGRTGFVSERIIFLFFFF